MSLPMVFGVPAHLPALGLAVLALLVLVAHGVRRLRARSRAEGRTRTPAAVWFAGFAAAACTAYSADTSWRFAEHQLDMANGGERAAMFGAGETALLACAVMARHNNRSAGSPGTPGTIIWIVTAVQVVAAYAESGPVGGTVRAVLGPIMAVLMWHLAMGIDLRHAKPGAVSQSLAAIVGRELRERTLSWLGLATRDRSAEQITRDRAMARAVRLAARLAQKKPDARGRTRLVRRLSKAVGAAGVGADKERRRKLVGLLAARRYASELATMRLPSPWHRHVICAGPQGTLLLRRPKPIAPSEPAGPVGEAVEELGALFQGVHAPVVYFARNGNRVKIGTSTNLKRRMQQFCLRPDDVELALHGDADFEGALHRRFDAYRIEGTEWFRRTGEVATFISLRGQQPEPAPEPAAESVPAQPPAPLAAVPAPELPAVPEQDRSPVPARPAPRKRNGTGSSGRNGSGKPSAFDKDVASARRWLAKDPELSGAEIGRKLGKSDRHGRNVRAAALPTGTPAPGPEPRRDGKPMEGGYA